MLDAEIAVQLRARGHDVEAVQREHPELMSLDDAALLERSTSMKRTLVTDNIRHFTAIHDLWIRAQRPHGGLLLASPRRYPRGKETIGLWLRGIEEAMRSWETLPMKNLCLWLPPSG